MVDDKADPNQIKYKGELVNGQLILTSVEYPPQFVNEAGEVIMTCETVEVAPRNVMSLFDDEYPMATSLFDEEPRHLIPARDQTILHKTVGGKGVVGRIK